MRSNHKAQAGIEYLIVVAIGLLLLTPVFVLGNKAITDFDASADQLLARQLLDKIEDASKLVYSQGEPAKITLTLRFPGNINSTRISDKILIITLKNNQQTNDIVSIVGFPVNGSLPTSPGNKKIAVEAKTNSTTDEVFVDVREA